MRSIKELLELLLIRLIMLQHNKAYVRGTGLCSVISDMYWDDSISKNEAEILRKFVKANAIPKWYMLRFYCESGVFIRNCKQCFAFYWKPGKLKPRIKWVKRQINKL